MSSTEKRTSQMQELASASQQAMSNPHVLPSSDAEQKMMVTVDSASPRAGDVNSSNSGDCNGRHVDQGALLRRITDLDGNLTFNQTPSERAHDDELERHLTDLAVNHEACSFDEWESLLEMQCPLPPRAYKYIDETDDAEKSVHTTARVYHKKFWIRHPDTGVIYEAITKPKDVKKHQKRLDQMRAVDEYLKAFSLTSSVQIYKRFKTAVGLRDDPKHKNKKKEMQKQEIAYKLIPGFMDRISFFGTMMRALLNAYFIFYNIEQAFTDENRSNLFYFVGILITAGAEAYLFLVALSRTLYNTKSLVERVLKNDTVHFQTKNMPMQIREMASTSILRYLPSGQTTNRLRKRYKEWWGEMMEDYNFAVDNARKHKLTVKIRESIAIGLVIVGPLLAVLALIFKVSSLDLHPDDLFGGIGRSNWFLEIFIPYLGFVNQIAGIRKVRLIEMDALQHFVFSGNDVKLSRHERQMMNVWWNFTVVSCVSNICDKFKYPTFDSIVFWYQLNPRKLQILLKNHDVEGEDFLQTKMKNGKRVIKTTPRDYDKDISKRASQRRLKKDTQTLTNVITQDEHPSFRDGPSSDVDDTIVATNAHSKISERVEKEHEKKDSVQVADQSDTNENANNNTILNSMAEAGDDGTDIIMTASTDVEDNKQES